MLFHHFERFLTEYEQRFEKDYGYFRPIVYANAHRGKVKKASCVPFALGMIEEEPKPFTSKGWAEMIRKVYEVDPLICPPSGPTIRRLRLLPVGILVVDTCLRPGIS